MSEYGEYFLGYRLESLQLLCEVYVHGKSHFHCQCHYHCHCHRVLQRATFQELSANRIPSESVN